MTSKRSTTSAYDLGMGDSSVRIEDAGDLRVRQAMISRPKSVPRTASVGEARALFANPKNRMLLVVDGERYAGHVLRDDIPDAATETDASPLWGHVRQSCPTIGPDAAISAALPLADDVFENRIVVVGDDGELAGLLCLNKRDGYLCVDVRG
jgi:CBS domain-containing protein